jgi:hypothetical protein
LPIKQYQVQGTKTAAAIWWPGIKTIPVYGAPIMLQGKKLKHLLKPEKKFDFFTIKKIL